MTTNNRIKVSDLDYNQIRENLKTFLRGQSEFSDYDFDGSALSTLVDLLAYNTHYNALYTNLAVNEMFLDSASKRSSIVSIANNFGYTPKSSKTAQALVNVTVDQVGATDTFKYIPKFSSFTTSIDGTSYTFWTTADYIAERNGTIYQFNNVELYEGLPQTQIYVCVEANQKFVLPNTDIDLDTLIVSVQQTGENPDYVKYTRAQDVLELTASSTVYFMKELEDGTYQLYFGTNDLGKSIDTGNIVTVEYLVTNKSSGNGASGFIYSGQSLGGTVSVAVTSASVGGSEKETSEEIRTNVSKTFFDQNRSVTASDYKSIIERLYPNIDAVNVWGGEDNVPPVYGKVFISVKPSNGYYLTPTEETYISENILRKRNVVSVTPEFVEPVYVDLEMTTTVYYNKNKTTRSVDDLKTAVINTINSYNDTYLQKFDGIFRMSKYSALIDAADQSIQSSISTFKVFIEIQPKYNVNAEYKLAVANPIYNEDVPEEAFNSTGFYIDASDVVYYLDDDGAGNVRVYSKIASTGEKVIKYPSIGTINYDTGSVYITGLRITNLYEPNFYFIIKTQSYDVVSVRNQIVNIPSDRITVNVIEDVTASGSYRAGTNYTFTSSRN